MQKKVIVRKLTLHKETLRSLDDKTLEKVLAGVEACPTLHCTKPEDGCTEETS